MLKAMYATFRELALFSPSFFMIKLPDCIILRFGLVAAVKLMIAVVEYIMLCSLVEVNFIFVLKCVSRENSYC